MVCGSFPQNRLQKYTKNPEPAKDSGFIFDLCQERHGCSQQSDFQIRQSGVIVLILYNSEWTNCPTPSTPTAPNSGAGGVGGAGKKEQKTIYIVNELFILPILPICMCRGWRIGRIGGMSFSFSNNVCARVRGGQFVILSSCRFVHLGMPGGYWAAPVIE